MQPLSEKIQPIVYDIDREYIQSILKYCEWIPYYHTKGEHIPNYYYAKYHDDQIEGFIDTMPFIKKVPHRKSIVKLTKNTTLPWHTDKNSKCAIIWGISGWETSCTYLGESKWVYKDALLNTLIKHKVVVGKEDKIIYKVSFPNHDFKWLQKQFVDYYRGFKIKGD